MAAHGNGGTGRRAVRWLFLPLLGVVWWWAAVRLALHPAAAGPVESAIVAGGWGLSLLPVHCVPRSVGDTARRGRAARGTPWPSWRAVWSSARCLRNVSGGRRRRS
ncbi:hypothetical protein [Streptomyces sp. NPDC018031]|uniref:hypothetical protein n=1 Tax=Streptomyces sp. NPDC018031 TaxID=3365033 RepID=UPI0037B2D048